MRWGKSVVVASLISFGAWAQGVGEEEPDLLDEPEVIEEDQQEVEPGIGGSEEMGTEQQVPVTEEDEAAIQGTEQPPDIIVEEEPTTPPPGAIAVEDTEFEETEFVTRPNNSGLTVLAGGGVEGYTGNFASAIDPGVGWSVVADIKPWRALGLELGYRGAANDIDSGVTGSPEGATNGADILRNGGHAAVIVAVPTAVQPYALAGFGIDRYDYRGDNPVLGLRDDTTTTMPVGLGLRTHTGGFTADLRASYDVLLNDDFSNVDSDLLDGRYAGMLQIGGTF